MLSRGVTGFKLHFAGMALAAVRTKDGAGLQEKQGGSSGYSLPLSRQRRRWYRPAREQLSQDEVGRVGKDSRHRGMESAKAKT